VITDVARPLDLPPEEVAKRPDVLVIESGEIELPSKVRGLKSIGLPPNVIYACLAETIVLALEGRFEVFTVGRDTEWQKVKEIYKLGLKHGMKLAAISGVKGVYSDADIAKVVELAKKARRTWKAAPAATGRGAATGKSPRKMAGAKGAGAKAAGAKAAGAKLARAKVTGAKVARRKTTTVKTTAAKTGGKRAPATAPAKPGAAKAPRRPAAAKQSPPPARRASAPRRTAQPAAA
jgi:hypothetical protein